jgi:hypothetical protein
LTVESWVLYKHYLIVFNTFTTLFYETKKPAKLQALDMSMNLRT